MPPWGPVIFLASLLAFCPWLPGYAQTMNGTSVFAPFVSKLRGEVRNNLIRLSWEDSLHVRGPVFIYRSKTPFNGGNPYYLLSSTEVPYGAQSYIDEISEAGDWHYFITASDESGQTYEVFMPYSNAITVKVDVILSESPRPVQRQDTASRITGLEASVRGDGILVSFRLSSPVRNSLLYRSVSPIVQTRDLLSAVLVEDEILSPYMDYPVPGIPYYYAVIGEDELSSGAVGIYPGYNATVRAVEIPSGSRIGLGDSPGLRSIPLPLISVNAVSPGSAYGDAPVQTPLSSEAAQAVNSLMRRVEPAVPEKTPRVFDQDLAPPAGGEEHTLRTIAQGSFRSRNWTLCKEELTRYLSLPRSAAPENRARFYLAQAHYFTGSYREALFEFLAVQSYYPAETAEWIQSALALMTQ